jgi:flagellar motor switch protein FliM
MASDDVLTEGEIDALMESVDDGTGAADAADDGQYRRFDFAAREKSLLREFTALGPLLERHAEMLSAALESAFSVEFSVRSEVPTLLSVADTLASLERSVAVTTSSLSPLAGPVFAIGPASLLSFIVNAYFGGGGHGAPADTRRSHLTPSELRLAERLAEIQLNCITQAWADKLPLEAGDLSTLGVPDRLEMLPGTDVLLRLAFTLSAGDLESTVQLLLPFSSLEPYRDRFAPPRKKEAADSGPSWEPFFRRELPGIELELAAVLATRPIALADLLQLQEGAIIPLTAPEMVSLKVENVLLAEGRFGTFEGFKAVQLQRLASLLSAGD